MKKILALAAFFACTAQQFNPPFVNSNQVVPGASSGECLMANPGGYITSGACNAGSPTLAGDNTWTGANAFTQSITIGVPSTDGPGALFYGVNGLFQLNSNSSSFRAQVECDIALGYGGPSLCIDSQGNLGTKSLNSSDTILHMGGFIGGATLELNGSQSPPSGTCVSGSLYVSRNGDLTSTLYVCVATAWAPPIVSNSSTRVLNDGTPGDPTHCVVSGRLGITAAAASTAVTFTGSAVFRGYYTLTINDNTSFAGGVTRTAQGTTGFTFNSTVGHVYSYQACGE
jgi:hypothetical protein